LPERIVSLVPSITELLADLGLDDEVVGLTRFCIHPAGWKERKVIVGGTKNLNLDRLARLAPDLVIANREENERDQVEAVAAFAHVHLADVATVDEGLSMIRTVGDAVGRGAEAARLADEIAARFARLAPAGAPLPAAYLIWREPFMTVGGDTFVSDVMARAGLRNVFAGRTRYPAVTVDDIAASGARVVLLSSEPYPFKDDHAAEIEAASGVPAALVDGEMFSWYGSRMRLMPAYLARLRARLAARLDPAP
jgi:ABC-type Fe3+-hydroxamate transport system substrate-binding protein